MALYFVRQVSARGLVKWFQVGDLGMGGEPLGAIEWDSLEGWRFYRRHGNYIWAPSYVRDVGKADKRFRVCIPLDGDVYHNCFTVLFPECPSVRDYSSPLFDHISRHMVELFVVDAAISLDEFMTGELAALVGAVQQAREDRLGAVVDESEHFEVDVDDMTIEGTVVPGDVPVGLSARIDEDVPMSLWASIKDAGVSSAVYDGSVQVVQLSDDN